MLATSGGLRRSVEAQASSAAVELEWEWDASERASERWAPPASCRADSRFVAALGPPRPNDGRRLLARVHAGADQAETETVLICGRCGRLSTLNFLLTSLCERCLWCVG